MLSILVTLTWDIHLVHIRGGVRFLVHSWILNILLMLTVFIVTGENDIAGLSLLCLIVDPCRLIKIRIVLLEWRLTLVTKRRAILLSFEWALLFIKILLEAKRRLEVGHGCSFHGRLLPLSWFFGWWLRSIDCVSALRNVSLSDGYPQKQLSNPNPKTPWNKNMLKYSDNW